MDKSTSLTPPPPLEIFFDGNCVVCSLEMSTYRRKVKKFGLSEKVQFVDISESTFLAEKYSLDPKLVNTLMHVKRGEKIFTGVSAFQEIWKSIPGYEFLLTLSKNPLVTPLMEVGYQVFIKIRPFLPKKK